MQPNCLIGDTGNTKILEGHEGAVRALAFSPDGKVLATGSMDTTVRLWDMEKNDFIGTLQRHSRPVFTLAFSPNGQHLASGSADKTIRIRSIPSYLSNPPIFDKVWLNWGRKSNLRVCLDTLEVVSATPFPDETMIWAPVELCERFGREEKWKPVLDIPPARDRDSRPISMSEPEPRDAAPEGKLLSAEDITRILDAEVRGFLPCFAGHKERRIDLAFWVASDGSIHKISIKQGNCKLKECIATHLRTVQFPASIAPRTVASWYMELY